MMDFVEHHPFLRKKAVGALASATSIFHVRCSLLKVENHEHNSEPCFSEVERGLHWNKGDHLLLQEQFEGLESRHPILGCVIGREFELLSNAKECVDIAGKIVKDNCS